MKPKSAKQKGKILEDWCADRLVETGLDVRAKRDGASGAGNREKGDVSTDIQIGDRNLGIECKNQKTISIPNWWKQTQKLEDIGREPVLIFKLPKKPLAETLVTIYFETFIELLMGNNPDKIEKITEKPEIKWKVKNLERAAKDLFKSL